MAVAEIGDKTQLLSLILAARFRRPAPILAGILLATLANHALAGAVGEWVTRLFGADLLRWLLAGSFLAMAAWILVPDQLEGEPRAAQRLGVLGTTLVAFFLAEMGDKTQLATVALAAKYTAFAAVVTGTTLGMLIANAPVVLLGERIARRIPLRLTRAAAAAMFAALGAAMIFVEA